MIISKCNRCGKRIEDWSKRKEVTCLHITFWEHDTKRYLCHKCYDKFQIYMKEKYNDFFTYLNEEIKKENETSMD